MSKGVIYILTNPSFPDYIKIGYAKNLERRLQQLTRSEMRRSVARGLDSLPDDARKILILRELDGLSYAEIGKVLHLEAGTVKSRLFRARRKLCDFLLADGNLPDQYASKQTKGGADG